jgi:Sulfotransferase family
VVAEPVQALPDRPIFVAGCPRSGTTLLQLMLHSHPRIAIPPETRFVVQAYRRRSKFGDLTLEKNRRALATWITDTKGTRFKDLKLDRAAVIERIVDGPPTVGSAVGAVLAAYGERFGKPRWGDKRPGYWQDLDVITRLFPDVQVVHIIRDGRACVASLKHMPWWNGGVNGAVATWAMAQMRCPRDTAHLPAGSYHEVHYEALVADPEPVLQELCAFLGEEYSPAMVEPALVSGLAVPQRKTWHTRTAGAVDASAVESWRTGLEPKELGLMETVAGRALRARGYRLSGAGARPSPALLFSYARERSRRGTRIRRRRLEDARIRRHEPGPVAAQLTFAQRGGAPAPRPSGSLEGPEDART